MVLDKGCTDGHPNPVCSVNFEVGSIKAFCLVKLPNSKILTHPLCPKDAHGMANSEDPDPTDLGLHCLPKSVCLHTLDHQITWILAAKTSLSRVPYLISFSAFFVSCVPFSNGDASSSFCFVAVVTPSVPRS